MGIKALAAKHQFDFNLGTELLKLHRGKIDVVEEAERWRQNRVLPLLQNLDEQWNEYINKVFGNLYRALRKYKIKQGTFDGLNLFMDASAIYGSVYWKIDRPALMQETFFDLYSTYAHIQNTYSSIASQVTQIKNFATITDFVSLTDTPTNYTGSAGLFVINSPDSTGFVFGKPAADVSFLELTDTLNQYGGDYHYLVTDPGGTLIQSTSTLSLRWNVHQHQCVAATAIVNLSGTSLDNVLYAIDLQDQITCPGQVLRLGTTFHGARVAFKAKLGDNNLNTKYVEGNTGIGVTIHEGNGAGRFQLKLGNAYTFIYDTSTMSYYKTGEYLAP